MDFEAQTNRGRLNLLVQLFENQSKAEEKLNSPGSCRTLDNSKLSLSLRERVSQETMEPFVDDSICSVGQLIKTFDIRQKTGVSFCPFRKCRRQKCSPQRYPEVHAMIEEIFNRIEEQSRRSMNFKSCCTLSLNLEPSFAISAEMVSCSPNVQSKGETASEDGEIGAIWTQDSLPSTESDLDDGCCSTDVHQLCSEKLSQYIDFFGTHLAASEALSSRCRSPAGSAGLKETITQVMTQMHQEVTNKDVPEPGVSVRSCRALIEMLVYTEQTPNPTVNIANRPPCALATDEADLIFSTDDLNFSRI